jgi:leader peptidase (prepilin peptidase)/N-methyltransferase
VSDAALAALCSVAGLLVGAWLPVVITRVPEKRPVRPAPYPEVAPALHTPVGWIIVLLTGALFAGMALRFGESWVLVPFLLFTAALVALSVIDLRLQLLPNRIVFPLAIVSPVLFAAVAIVDSDGDAFLRSLGCAFGAFVVFTVLHLVSPRAMGFGDVKLSFILGLYLGWLGVGETVLGLLLGFVYGAVIGLVLLATRSRGRKDHIPFGPFLAAGALTAVLVGTTILDWYRG